MGLGLELGLGLGTRRLQPGTYLDASASPRALRSLPSPLHLIPGRALLFPRAWLARRVVRDRQMSQRLLGQRRLQRRPVPLLLGARYAVGLLYRVAMGLL